MRILVALGLILGSVLVSCVPALAAGWTVMYDLPAKGALLGDDCRGNLWLSSSIGLIRCDGAGFTTYSACEGTPLNDVKGYVEDGLGNLWFWGGSGVCSYDGERFHEWAVPDTSGGTTVSTIFRDHAGTIWFAVEGGGVTTWDGDAWITYTTQQGLVSDSISVVFEDAAHSMWLGSNRGVNRYDGSTWRTFTQADGLGVDAVDKILQDGDGRIWFLDCGGGPTLSSYDGSVWVTYEASDLYWAGWYSSAAIDPGGSLVVAGWGYHARFNGSGWDVEEDEMGCSYVFRDRRTCFWLLHERGGVERVWGSRHDYYEAPAFPQSFLADRRGHIWVASGMGAGWLYRFDPTEHDKNWLEPSCMMEDRRGSIWCGGEGVLEYSNDTWDWITYTTEDGLPSNHVQALFEDADGAIWSGTDHGAARFDGAAWTAYTTADGLISDSVLTISQDRSGALWFGTPCGASRFDGETWSTYTAADGLPGDAVVKLLRDTAGTIWAYAEDRVAVFDGASWLAIENPVSTITWVINDGRGWLWFGTDEGLYSWDGSIWASRGPTPYGTPIFGDRQGNIWLNQDGATAKFDGESCWLYDWWDEPVSGIPTDVFAGLADRSGRVWFGTPTVTEGNRSWGGLYMSVLDNAPPYTGIRNPPPRLTPERSQIIGFATLQEPRPCAFSYSINGSSWSAWSSDDLWAGDNLPDGVYSFWLRSRDWLGNVDSIGSRITFEIDGTPPTPVLASPTFGQVVRDSIMIRGTADDGRFAEYTLGVCSLEAASTGAAEPQVLAHSTAAVHDGVVGRWNTAAMQDGSYQIRLSVRDSLGLVGLAVVEVVVDNHAPWADETAPALVSATAGGDVYTSDGRVHLYFPPRAFGKDAPVSIVAAADTSVPDRLPDGATRAYAGYDISWGGHGLQKPGVLDVTLGGLEPPDSSPVLALYILDAASTWLRIGGTSDAGQGTASAPLEHEGRYALFFDDGDPTGRSGLSSVSVAPRAFSPTGSFANNEVAIGFTLGQPGPVTVKIYNRAGRLVREVVRGRQMNAGANLVRWDGRDRDRAMVGDGIYVVSVEASGDRQVKTLAVVR